MKKLILSLALLFSLMSFVKAQPLTLTMDGNPIGETLTLSGAPTDFEVVLYANVHNNSDHDMNIKVIRNDISLIEGTYSNICWAGSCYPPTVDTSLNSQLIVAGGSSADEDFSGHYAPNGHLGTSIVEFTFYNMDNPSEFVSVTVYFVVEYAGIAEDAMKGGSISEIYPNPATNYVNLDFSLTPSVKEAKVRVINLLGSVVKEAEIEKGANQMKLDVSDLDNGVYFYSVLINGETYKTRKLVIK